MNANVKPIESIGSAQGFCVRTKNANRSSRRNLDEVLKEEACLQFIMNVGNLIEEVWKVTTEIHLKGSKGSHSGTKEDSREIGVKRMSQREFDREVTELKKGLSKVVELLHEESIEGQFYEWKLKRRVQGLVQRLSARNLKNKLSVWVKKEERLRVAEHEEEVHMV